MQDPTPGTSQEPLAGGSPKRSRWPPASALMLAVLAGGVLAQVADHVSTEVSAAVVDDASVDLRGPVLTDAPDASGNLVSPLVSAVTGDWRGSAAAGAGTTQAGSCDTNWDCGSALACDRQSECSVDRYACVVSQRTGLGQCVHQGFCSGCQPADER